MEILPIERLDQVELETRHARCRELLGRLLPQAGGLMVFSPLAIYYLSGTLGNGVFWLPQDALPVLFSRRGIERARVESPLQRIESFRSYSEIPKLLAKAGAPLPSPPEAVAAEMGGLSWSLANLLQERFPRCEFIAGDMILSRARAIKSLWELNKLRLAGARHHDSLYHRLPERLASGQTEREISLAVWDVFFSHGHCGLMRMSGLGEEMFLGHVSAGDSANYPSRYNGPVGLRGEHPTVPFMGYAGSVWSREQLLTCDVGFCLEGYHTDKTQVYWSGKRGTLDPQLAKAHEFCIETQSWLASQLKPGAIPSALYAASLERAQRAGYSEGFMALDGNKVPFVGHGIGLSIDEWPVLAKGFDEPLQAGMTLALEPKIGIRDRGMVGVENTFEVTEAGGRCLTGDAWDIVCIDV